MKIYHQLDQKKTPVKNPNGEFYPLLLIVENNDQKIEFPSKISKFLNIYSSEVDRYVSCEKEVKDLFLTNFFRSERHRFCSSRATCGDSPERV